MADLEVVPRVDEQEEENGSRLRVLPGNIF